MFVQSITKLLAVSALLIGVAAWPGDSARAAGDGLIIKDSAFSVAKTIDRLGMALERKGIRIFGRVNHGKAASSIGMEMTEAEVLIFGTPKIGTPLMQSNPMIGLDLPLKALAWKAADGSVKLAYTNPAWLAERYRIGDLAKVFKGMAGALDKFTTMATTVGGLPK